MFDDQNTQRRLAEDARRRAEAERDRKRKKKEAEKAREKERLRKAEQQRFSDEMAAQYEKKQANRNGKGPNSSAPSLSRGGKGSSYSNNKQGQSGPSAPSLGRGKSNSQQITSDYDSGSSGKGLGKSSFQGPRLKRF